MDLVNIVRGIIGVIIGVVLIIVGLSPDMSCGLIRVLGGQCVSLFGNLLVEGSFSILPTILLGMGALLILVGSITAATEARR